MKAINSCSKLLLLLSSLLLFSCVTQEKCLRKFPPQVTTEKTVEIHYKDTIIQGGTVERIINNDSLIYLPGQTIIDTSGSAVLSFYKDAYGNLVAKCEAKDKTIEGLTKEIREKETKVEIHKVETKYIPWWMYAILGITSFLSIVGMIALKPWRILL